MQIFVRIAADGKLNITPQPINLALGDSVLIGTPRQKRYEPRPRREVVLDTAEKLELAVRGRWSELNA